MAAGALGTALVTLGIAMTLPACSPAYLPPVPDVAMIEHSQASAALVRRGFEVHQEKCAKCHAFENPAHYRASDLTGRIIPKMADKAKLDASDEKAVMAYLLAARKSE